jgi:MFS family permease
LAWVFDIPGAIQTPLTEWFGGPDKYTKSMNLALYSVYSWPNTVLALFGGLLIDRYLGIRAAALLFCTCVLVGQTIFALAVQFKTYPLAVVGRFIYGLGGETLTVAQTAWTVRWFEGPQLALAIGIVFAFTRIGSATNFAVTPQLANLGVPTSIWFGTGMCALSMVFCLIAFSLDRYTLVLLAPLTSNPL